jgi:hypothetical protein
LLNSKGWWVLSGVLIVLMSLLILVIMYIFGMFDKVQQGVDSVRQVKDMVDEVVPGAIPAVSRGVQRGLDVVSGRRPHQQPPQQYPQQPPQQYSQQPPPQYSQQPPPQYQQTYAQEPYGQSNAPPPEPPVQRAVGPLYHPCPTCGAGNAPGDAYCHYCKRPLR